MILGQIVAISVASNLFHVALLLSGPRPKSQTIAPARLWIPVIMSLVAVFLSPFTSETTFLPNLLVMHVLIIVPLVSSSTGSRWSISLTKLYTVACVVSTLLHLRATSLTMSSVSTITELWTTLHSHPAQSSIGWDVVWTTVSSLAWIVTEEGGSVAGIILAPVVGVAGYTPWILRGREASKLKSS